MYKQTYSTFIDLEEFSTLKECDVHFVIYPEVAATNYSPAEPKTLEIINITLEGTDITSWVSNDEWGRILEDIEEGFMEDSFH